MLVYIEEQLIYVYSVVIFWMEPLAPRNHTKTPWCLCECFAREGVKYLSSHTGMLSTLTCYKDETSRSLGLEAFRTCFEWGFSMSKLSGCPAVLSYQRRQEGTTDGRSWEARSLLLKAGTSENFFPRTQGKDLQANGSILCWCLFKTLSGVALFLNSPWVCLSLTSGTGDCLALVTHGITTCIPGSPGKVGTVIMLCTGFTFPHNLRPREIIRLSSLMSSVSEAVKCCTRTSRLRQLLSLAHSILVLEKPNCYVSKAVPEIPAILENWLGMTCPDNHRDNPRKKSTILANLS